MLIYRNRLTVRRRRIRVVDVIAPLAFGVGLVAASLMVWLGVMYATFWVINAALGM